MRDAYARKSSGFRLFNLSLWPIVLVPALLGSIAQAHGFGQRYDLPVPLSFYLTGAGAAVVLSFVVAAVFLRAGSARVSYPRLNLLRSPLGRALLSRPVGRAIEIVSVAIFLLVLTAGLIGSPNQSRNVAPLIVWVIWWVGITYVSALVGNIWPLINPWRIIFSWIQGLARRVASGAALSLELPYPRWLGIWPGVALFFAFAWLEIAFADPARPSNIATMILVYSIITWTGMVIFGQDEWLRRGEAFTLVFGLLSRFAPTETRVLDGNCSGCSECGASDECINCWPCYRDAQPEKRQFNFRPFAAGLLHTGGVSVSMMALVLLVLSTVTFDGFADTPSWASIVTGYYRSLGHIDGVTTLGLLTLLLTFLALYLVTAALMPLLAGQRVSLQETARQFVLTLVPIALAYHLAHYLTYLLVQGQQLIPLASDPFGFGWDLFGSADYTVDINVVGAQFAWYTAVISIVVGHIIAVWLAHLVALRLFRGHGAALRSQYPMLILMVAYTAISLWILAQPIVEVVPPS